MGAYTNFVRGIVKKNSQLKLKLKKSGNKLTPFQYVHQTIFMSGLSSFAVLIIIFLFTKSNFIYLLVGLGVWVFLIPIIYTFWFSYVDVQIRKYGRELEDDILFISEYFLVSLQSGLPLGNAIQKFSKLNRPGGKFFKRVFTEFQTGKDLEGALNEAAGYSPSENLRILLKRLHDSLSVGVELNTILENFIQESSEKKVVDIQAYSKKLNPIIMIYLLLGIVVPSLGITFFILGATLMQITPSFLKLILIFIFLLMYGFQYFAYSAFKFSKSSI